MSTITFDTLKFVERLEKAGASRELASALVEVQKESLAEIMDSTLATKSDIRSVRDDLVKMDRRMDGLDAKFDKISWMLGILIALAVANFAKQFF
jgi:cell division protein FtsX